MKLRLIFLLLIIIASILAMAIFWLYSLTNYQKTDNAYIRGSITNISSRIEGYVENVPAILNTRVKKGDVIVKFDVEPFKAKYELALAELDAAKAMVEEIRTLINSENIKIDKKKLTLKLSSTNIKIAETKVMAEKSNLKFMTEEKKRMNELLKRKTISQAKFDRILTDHEISLYKLSQLKSDIEALKISHQVIKKEVKEFKIKIDKLISQKQRATANKDALTSKVKSAKIDFDSATIRAPIDGIIANRIVEPGVYMKKGWPLMSIVPLKDIWVIANFKETQIKNIEVGQKVKIKVDAYSEMDIIGKVLSISPASASSFSIIPPQNASGNFVKVVQRIPVKITFKVPKKYYGKVVPGLSVVAKVITSD